MSSNEQRDEARSVCREPWRGVAWRVEAWRVVSAKVECFQTRQTVDRVRRTTGVREAASKRPGATSGRKVAVQQDV